MLRSKRTGILVSVGPRPTITPRRPFNFESAECATVTPLHPAFSNQSRIVCKSVANRFTTYISLGLASLCSTIAFASSGDLVRQRSLSTSST